MSAEKIGAKIKKERNRMNITQRYVAKKLNLNQTDYSKRERGMINFRFDELVILSELLNFSLDQFVNELGECEDEE